ncbi:DUF2156 domain-containing protein [Geobacter argillaceus]|uniref:Phosphatidylglycerol lysyltransferase C-terminal domain-containing protein n=1 Tax=Geobacter argillaceus TaxID=345631 RepID=A0A562WTF9_9BACT|nr:phosphatidylglycerol lysyltransferase domain-containing protein [Geobacter argillaceus]TWJ32724.1 hypothetical protein JN12_00699 [Geobacter argillaceus]
MTIPTYPERRPLALSDKGLLDKLFARLQPQLSECTFAGLYLFRQPHDYHLTLVGNALVVLGRGYDGNPYFLPPLSGDIKDATRILLAHDETLYGADEPFVKRYLADIAVQVSEDRDNFDYLYQRQELAELPGNRYHKKKNRINYFTARHSHAVELFGPAHREGSLLLLDDWLKSRRDEEQRTLVSETAATAEALELHEPLDLQGVVVLVNGEVKGFALGERLNTETAVCHFEKADPFMEGLPQLVNREFSRLLFNDCRFINREQDLGEPGLRAAKLSYHPVGFVRKYRIRAT